MTHRQPKFSQVLVCEIGQDVKIDIVLSKALGVLGHPKFVEPICNLRGLRSHAANSSRRAFASFRSSVSNPSVNQL